MIDNEIFPRHNILNYAVLGNFVTSDLNNEVTRVCVFKINYTI